MPNLGSQTMDKECEYCGRKIPRARLSVLPGTTTCVNCSVEQGYIGIITTDERSDGIDIQISKPDYSESEEPRKKKHRPRREEND